MLDDELLESETSMELHSVVSLHLCNGIYGGGLFLSKERYIYQLLKTEKIDPSKSVSQN